MLFPSKFFKIQGATMKSVFIEWIAGGTPADSEKIHSRTHLTKQTRLGLKNAEENQKREKDRNTKKNRLNPCDWLKLGYRDQDKSIMCTY